MPVAETPWQLLLRYIVSREPSFPTRVRGAAPHELERLLAHCPMPVPVSAIELLSTMGHGSDVFWPFNKRFEVDVSEMLEDLDDQCIDGRFFRVAMVQDDQEIGDADLYIDLNSSNGYDAVLTQIAGESDGRTPHEGCHTLMSKVIYSAFRTFNIASSGEWGSLGQGMNVSDFPAYLEAFRSLMARMGLQAAFLPREDLQCYCSDTLSLMFDAIGPGIPLGVLPGESPPTRCYLNIWIGTTDFDALRNVAAQIRDAMPSLPFFTRWLPTGPVDADRPE